MIKRSRKNVLKKRYHIAILMIIYYVRVQSENLFKEILDRREKDDKPRLFY